MKTPGSVVSEPFVPKVIHKNKLKIPKNQEWKVPIMRKWSLNKGVILLQIQVQKNVYSHVVTVCPFTVTQNNLIREHNFSELLACNYQLLIIKTTKTF